MSYKSQEISQRLITFADKMLKYGTDRYGEEHSPMFACNLHCARDNPGSRSPDLPGQRVGDRSVFGTNLMYDIPLLRTFMYLSEYTGDPKYHRGVEDYLEFFVRRCPDPATGLFPWGEHTYWHHYYDRAYACGGELGVQTEHTHDHLRAAPAWFWQEVQKLDPKVVERFGDGLTGHLVGPDNFEFSRHASIGKKSYSGGQFQFPRHAGFYVFDWSCAYVASGEVRFLDRIDGMVQYMFARRSPALGLMIMSDYGGSDAVAFSQTASFALSLTEACEVLTDVPDPRIETWRASAGELAGSVAEVCAKTDLDISSEFFDFHTGEPSGMAPGEERTMPIWYSSYGVNPLSFMGLLANGLYRHGQDERLLDYSRAVAERYLTTPFPYPKKAMRRHDYSDSITARDLALALHFACDMIELDENPHAQAMALILIPFIMDHMFENGWLCAASDFPYYDGQTDPGRLAYALLRYAALAEGSDMKVAPDYQAR